MIVGQRRGEIVKSKGGARDSTVPMLDRFGKQPLVGIAEKAVIAVER